MRGTRRLNERYKEVESYLTLLTLSEYCSEVLGVY